MRLLLCNPNSNAGLTARLGEAAARLLGPDETLTLATADRGPGFIGSEETIAEARAHLEETLPSLSGSADVILLGCFGDLGIDDLKRGLDTPVLSLWDACLQLAGTSPSRYGIVTTSRFWVDRLQRDIAGCGLAQRITSVSEIAGAATLAPSDLGTAVRNTAAQISAEGDVDRVVPGGALLAALPMPAADGAPPIVDLLQVAIHQCRQRSEGGAIRPGS